MLKKNDYFEAECIDYSFDGMGIVKVEGVPYFVKGMLKGEEGKLKVIKVLKTYGIARLIELTKTSPERVEPKCAVYKACGGCHIQHLSTKEQQEFKTKYVVDCFERIAKINTTIYDCHMMEGGWNYRNKVQLPCGMQDGHLVTGFYKQHSNDIVVNDICEIQDKDANALSKRTKEVLDSFKIKAYNKMTHVGLMRHIMVKVGVKTGELMLVLITNGNILPHKKEIVSILTQEFPNLKTIIQNVNERHDNVILGEKEYILFGKGYIYDYLEDIQFQISSKSFYQVNPKQAEILYRYALDFAGLTGNEEVIDAYCGIGTISLFLARYAKKVYGVEIVQEAIDDANKNAKANDITNVEFTCEDAKTFMTRLASENKHMDVVVCDPPRKGCSQEFLDAITVLQPSKFVYVSCNVATQARDVAYLKDKGYEVVKVQPVDMFPHTFGVESVALLVKTM